MFICRNCEMKNEIPIPAYQRIFAESYGKCELCGKIEGCVDYHGRIPSKEELIKKHEKRIKDLKQD